MKIPHDHPVNVDVLVHGMSIKDAAAKHGIPASTLRVALLAHPDYEKAKAEGKMQKHRLHEPKPVEELRQHPAVVEALTGEKTQAEVAMHYGITLRTLARWLRAVREDAGVAANARTKDNDPATQVALATIKQLASTLEQDPVKVCRSLLRRLEAEAAQAKELATAP